MWWYILTISNYSFDYQGHWVKVIPWKMVIWLSGHQFNWFDLSEVKITPGSRSFQGQIVSVWLSIGKREVGLCLKGILVSTCIFNFQCHNFIFSLDRRWMDEHIHFGSMFDLILFPIGPHLFYLLEYVTPTKFQIEDCKKKKKKLMVKYIFKYHNFPNFGNIYKWPFFDKLSDTNV